MLTYFKLFLITFVLTNQALANRFDPQVVDLIRNIVPNLHERNLSVELTRLEDMIQEKNIDISDYRLGKGVIPFWKKENAEILESEYQGLCKSGSTYYQSQHTVFADTQIAPTSKIAMSYEPKINISVVSLKEAEELFFSIYTLSDKLAPEEYGNRCESRAHAISLILDQSCITTGKVFIQSEVPFSIKNHTWGWYYHVAPYVLVKIGEKTVPYVFDHSLFNKIKPLSEWIEVLRKKNMNHDFKISFTSKYTFEPEDIGTGLTEYLEEDIDEMQYKLRLGRLLRLIRPFKGDL